MSKNHVELLGEKSARSEMRMNADLRQLLMEDAFPRPVTRMWLGELLKAFNDLSDRVITLEARIADRDQRLPLEAEHRTIADMIAYVADKLVTSSAAIRGDERDERYVMGRQLIVYAAHLVLDADFTAIGRALGNRSARQAQELHDRAEMRRRGYGQFPAMLEMVVERFSGARG